MQFPPREIITGLGRGDGVTRGGYGGDFSEEGDCLLRHTQ